MALNQKHSFCFVSTLGLEIVLKVPSLFTLVMSSGHSQGSHSGSGLQRGCVLRLEQVKYLCVEEEAAGQVSVLPFPV